MDYIKVFLLYVAVLAGFVLYAFAVNALAALSPAAATFIVVGGFIAFMAGILTLITLNY